MEDKLRRFAADVGVERMLELMQSDGEYPDFWAIMAEYDELKRENERLRAENEELRRKYCAESLGGEEWRDVVGGEGFYQVSNIGRVKSFVRKRVRFLTQTKYWGGYFGVGLRRLKDATSRTFLVHRLVAQAFIPNPECKPFVNHINGIKTDNRVENLEWVTGSENLAHSYRVGLRVSARGKLSEEDVRYIRENPDGLTRKQLSEKFGVAVNNICQVCNYKSYKYVK